MSGPFILATSTGAADLDFPSLGDLARHVVAVRGRAPLQGDGLPPELVAIDAALWRHDMPGAHAVAVRMRDGGPAGRGSLIGYVLMPSERNRTGVERVMGALRAAALGAIAGAAA